VAAATRTWMCNFQCKNNYFTEMCSGSEAGSYLRFRVSGFGCRVSGFGFRVSGFGFQDWRTSRCVPSTSPATRSTPASHTPSSPPNISCPAPLAPPTRAAVTLPLTLLSTLLQERRRVVEARRATAFAAMAWCCVGLGFRVSGFGFRVSGFGSRISGIWFRVSGTRFLGVMCLVGVLYRERADGHEEVHHPKPKPETQNPKPKTRNPKPVIQKSMRLKYDQLNRSHDRICSRHEEVHRE